MRCRSLRSINQPSARIVETIAFAECTALTDVKFGNKLERIESHAFHGCPSLERITVPLKDGMITHGSVFQGCDNLYHVALVEGAELLEAISALQLEEWKNDLNTEIVSINQILPNADPGYNNVGYYNVGDSAYEDGEKALEIRRWIRSVLSKINHYKAEHQRALDEAASTLELLPLTQDIVTNNILPFLELPSHTFG